MRTVLALFCLLTLARIGHGDDRPNIVVFYTDDHGYADLSCQGVFQDVRTPNVDALAKNGVRALHGYSTAPQCVPSRAGLLIGKFQAKFGVESNGKSLDGFDRELTIAERLQPAGYVTAQFGKWHLGAGPKITEHGFKYVYNQNAQRPFAANITTTGEDRPMGELNPDMYHVDACSHAAASVIKRHKDDPFFLYVAYRAPHVPLDAPKKYLDRFPGKMPERRRQALAMLSAVDDGVGLVMKTLADNDLTKETLVFYIGDNGAPLKIHKLDAPGGGPGWDGSLNDPLNGEKGMLSEGGMHTPFVVSWPGKIPAGQEYPHPISALDVAATAAAIAGIETKSGDLDGVNLIPFLSGENSAAPHEALMWRWISQSAIREGNWKLLRGGPREYLYNLEVDLEEKNNLAAKYPDIANRLRGKLEQWSQELSPPGLATEPQAATWNDYFDFYLDGKPALPLREKFVPKDETESANANGPWLVRGGKLIASTGLFDLVPDGKGKSEGAALIRNGIKLDGPVTVEMEIKTSGAKDIGLAWRTSQDKTFTDENRTSIKLAASDDWQTVSATIPSDDKIVHVRFQMPAGTTKINSLKLKPASGKSVDLPK
ncbi:MAG: sulfatase-like hydrolase/transferase [Pirellulaceae bacterium]